MNDRNKPVHAYLEEEKGRSDFNSYKAAEEVRPGDVFNPKTNKKNQKNESKWIDSDQLVIYGVIAVVVIIIVLVFVFL
jgi:hypothetical protein